MLVSHQAMIPEPSSVDPLGDESQLIARVRAGDPNAFNAMFVAYYGELLAFAKSYVHALDAAQDVVQDVFARIWEHREEWTVRGGVAQYLYGATRNRSLNMLKHDAVVARWEASQSLTNDTSVNEGADQILARELAALVTRTVATLPPRCQEVFRMSRFARLSQRDIAETLGISVNTVNNHLTRALRSIDAALQETDRTKNARPPHPRLP